jgi:hypothetical protein
MLNSREENRLEFIAIAKLRGKGPPKKKTEKDSRYSPDVGMSVRLICACGTSVEAKEKEVVRSIIKGYSGVVVNTVTLLALFGLAAQNGVTSSAKIYTSSKFAPATRLSCQRCSLPTLLRLNSHIALPPSTSMFTPVMNLPSSLAKNNAAFATSFGSVNLPCHSTCQSYSLRLTKST